MPKTLLEYNYITVDLNSIVQNREDNTASKQSDKNKQSASASNSSLGSDIEAELKDQGIEPEVIAKLATLGDLFKKSLRILGFKKDDPKSEHNPILRFIKQDHVQKLITDGLLNANTFKGIYNAVAKNLVATSEFFNTNSYNIIYCRDLYTKSAAVMEEYLKLQSTILKVSDSAYDTSKQIFNRKVFLQIPGVTERDATKLVKIVLNTDAKKIPSVTNKTVLNSIKLATAISGKQDIAAAPIDTSSQDAIVNKLTTSESLAAAILALSLTTDSSKANQALSSGIFANVDSSKVVAAASKIATSDILPKGQVQTADADALVDKIIAKIQQLQQNKNT